MKVMMIGLSSAGKTSYMGAMYEKFRKGLGGFSIRAVRDEDDRVIFTIGIDVCKRRDLCSIFERAFLQQKSVIHICPVDIDAVSKF